MNPLSHFDTLGLLGGEEAMGFVVVLAQISGRYGQRVRFSGRVETQDVGNSGDAGREWENILGDGSTLLKSELSVLEDRGLSQCRSAGLLEASGR